MNYLQNIKRVCDFAPKNATVPVMGMVYIADGKLHSNTYAGGGICLLPPNFKGVKCSVEAATFMVAITSLGADCKVTEKDGKLILSNGSSSIRLGTTNDEIPIEIPDVPGFELTKDAHDAISRILPYCGHRKEVSIHGLIYCKDGEVFTTDSASFCKRKVEGKARFQVHGQCFMYLYPGDEVALASASDNGLIYVKSDGFWGKISNPTQKSFEDQIQVLLSRAEKFPLACEFDGSQFVAAAQMVSKLSCSYLCIGKGKITGLNEVWEPVFSNDFPYEGSLFYINPEYASKIAASCKTAMVQLLVGSPPNGQTLAPTIMLKTEDCDIFYQTIGK